MTDLGQFNAVEVPLTNGGFAVVNTTDAPIVLQYRWCGLQRRGRTTRYARSTQLIDGKHQLLHRFLTAAKDGQLVDHRDRDGLNNRRSNIRIATRSQNGANRDANPTNRLGVKGVRRRKSGRFEARIIVAKRYIHLGDFSTVEEASLAYRKAAAIHFGEFARWAKQS